MNLLLLLGAVKIAHANLAKITRMILVHVGTVVMLEQCEQRVVEVQARNGVLDLQRDPYRQDVYDASQRARGLRRRGHGAFSS